MCVYMLSKEKPGEPLHQLQKKCFRISIADGGLMIEETERG